MKFTTHPHTAAMALALVLALPAFGGSINVDFSRDPSSPLGGASPVLHDAIGPAPDSGTTWNDYRIFIPDTNGNSSTADDVIATPYLVNDLVDSSGAATTVDVELTSGWFRAFNGSPVNTMQKEWLFARNSTGIVTVKGLDPLLTYDFHLIGSGNYNTNFTIGGITKPVTGIFSQSDVGLWTQGAQYTVFTGIMPDAGGNVSISVVANSGADGAIAAMQISPSNTPAGDFFYADAVTSTGGEFNSSYLPENLFSDGFTSPAGTIDTTTTYPAAGNNYASASGTTDNFDLTFEFSGPAEVNGMHVWNYTYRTSTGGGATGPLSGVNAYTLTFYDGPGGSGSAIGSIYNGSLAQASFDALSMAESVYFPAAYQNVRSVVMRVISNHGSAAFTGLNELAFNGTASSSAITSFTASASFVQRPALPSLSWEIEGDITSLEITPDVGDVTANTTDGIGSIEVAPIGDQTYTLVLNGSIEQTVNVVGLPTKEKLHIYLLIGQSNMQGEGNDGKNTNLDAPHPRVVKFGSRSDSSLVDFVTGGHRLTSYDWAPGSDIGMGVEFGKTLIASGNDPEVVVCLINHALGGTAIEWWEPGVADPIHINPETSQPYVLYDEAISRTLAASSYGTVKGVLWHQGEYNVNNGTVAPGYPARLAALVDNLRDDLDSPGLPFVCGKLVPTYNFANDRTPVETALAALPAQRSNTFCVDNNGLAGNAADPIHFDAPSQRLLGQRYAGAILGFHSNSYLFYLGGFLTPAELMDAQLTDPHADNDRDGFNNFLEFAFLTNPLIGTSTPVVGNGSISIPGEGEFPTISYRERKDTEAPDYIVEVSSDLVEWTDNHEGPAVTETVGQGVDHGDGIVTVTVRALTPITPAAPRSFLRVRVEDE